MEALGKMLQETLYHKVLVKIVNSIEYADKISRVFINQSS